MNNADMISGRFLKLYMGRKLIKSIKEHLASDGIVMLSTYGRTVQYNGKRHVESFKVGKKGTPFVARGRKSWDDMSRVMVTFYTKDGKFVSNLGTMFDNMFSITLKGKI